MLKIKLSSNTERAVGCLLFFILLLLSGLLAYVLRADTGALVMIIIAAVVALLLTGLYLVSVFRAACLVSRGSTALTISGLGSFETDIKDAASVKTAQVVMGPLVSRRIVFLRADGAPAASVSTFFTAKKGALAEPAAKQIAEALGLTFIPTLQLWEYDRAAKKEHDRALAKEKREQKKQRKSGKKPAAPTQNAAEAEEESINYDAMDDEK